MYESIEHIIIVIGAISIVIFILYLIFRSPFHYPYFKYFFDVSGKRNPDILDLIDDFFNQRKFLIIKRHKEKIEQWKMESQRKIEKSKLKKYRTKQYQKSLDDNGAYNFYLTRKQTRYKQINYMRTPYKVLQTIASYNCDYIFFLFVMNS